MELADIINPSPKSQIGDNDKIFVFDGQDVFLVPAKHASDFPKVNDTLGGIVAADESNNFGQIEVEDLIVAMVGIDFALKNASSGNFENAYSEKFNIGNVIEKLNENHLIPEDAELGDVVADYDEDRGLLSSSVSFYPKEVGVSLDTQVWQCVIYRRNSLTQDWTMMDSMTPGIDKDGNTLFANFDSIEAKDVVQFKVEYTRASIGIFYEELAASAIINL